MKDKIMKTSEIKNRLSTSNGLVLDIDTKAIENFNSTFIINNDSEKEPAKIINKVFSKTVALSQPDRKHLRNDALMYDDFMVGGTGENKNELNISKINSEISKLCLGAREILTKDKKKTGIFLVPFKVASRQYCWTLISKNSLQHQIELLKGNKIKDNK